MKRLRLALTIPYSMNKFPLILSLLFLASGAAAQQPPPLEAYGALPEVNNVAISPNGGLVAYRQTDEEQDAVIVIDVDRMQFLGGINVEAVKPRDVYFVDDETLLLVASDTVRSFAVRGPWENSAAFIYNIPDDNLFRLLQRADDLVPQEGLGRVVGRTASGDRLFMPAFVGDPNGSPQYSLFAVDTDRRRERVVERGRPTTIDYFIDAQSTPFIREDFDNESDLHHIWALRDGRDVLLYEEEGDYRVINPLGLTEDRKSLIFSAISGRTDSRAYYPMDTETGEVGARLFGRENSSINSVVMDIDRVVYGVEYEGFYPTYEFLDPGLSERITEIQEKLPGAAVRLVSWSDDFDRLVVHASGGWTSGVFLLFTEGNESPQVLARQRELIPRQHVADTIVGQYQARDGLAIPALVTAYPRVIEAGNAPLILLPHGGPAAHDTAEFDWLAQFFASRGYVVLQPQFRGSTGFGYSHREAGEGEWGRKMQTDLDDGIAWLSGQGVIDPERVCIVGGSYGGYAALAAGAFSPDLYRCHVSINGVSDLRVMLRDRRTRYGRDHWVVGYWERFYGVELDEREELDALSPAQHPEAFQSPVLLIHGRDDTVVPIEQSRRMRSALRGADKDVELVQIRGEDHWLSSEETRIEVLRIVAEFIEEHL